MYKVNKRNCQKFPNYISILQWRSQQICFVAKKTCLSFEYMDSWKKFGETSLPDKKVFCSELNLEDITDKDYEHTQKVWSVFKI